VAEDFLSLYDYLGRPAGKQLGKEVRAEAKKQNQEVQTRDIHAGRYHGKVTMYNRAFLDQYFKEKPLIIP